MIQNFVKISIKTLIKKVNEHESRLNNHSERLDKLEQYKSKSEEKIDNLCVDLRNLTSTLRWGIGILAGGIISFFIYLLQLHVK